MAMLRMGRFIGGSLFRACVRSLTVVAPAHATSPGGAYAKKDAQGTRFTGALPVKKSVMEDPVTF